MSVLFQRFCLCILIVYGTFSFYQVLGLKDKALCQFSCLPPGVLLFAMLPKVEGGVVAALSHLAYPSSSSSVLSFQPGNRLLRGFAQFWVSPCQVCQLCSSLKPQLISLFTPQAEDVCSHARLLRVVERGMQTTYSCFHVSFFVLIKTRHYGLSSDSLSSCEGNFMHGQNFNLCVCEERLLEGLSCHLVLARLGCLHCIFMFY